MTPGLPGLGSITGSPAPHSRAPAAAPVQKPIDLLPEAVRLRCQAGVRTGRYITALAVAVIVILVATTLSHIEAERARERLIRARGTAELVLQTETRVAQIQSVVAEAERRIELHDRIALPVRLSSLLATIVNRLPASISLDRIDLNASRSGHRGPRTRVPSGRPGGEGDTASRILTGEISGFAASDEDIAMLVAHLRDTPPLEAVSLDFSRTRMVRAQPAREFRLSFRIDLNAARELPSEGEATTEEVAAQAVNAEGGSIHAIDAERRSIRAFAEGVGNE